MNGQTLEQLFINIAPKYLNKEDAKRVKKDISDIDRRVTKLGDTLAKIGTAFAAFGVIGVKAFSDTERAMSEFAGKSGTHMRKFEAMFAKSSERIARQTGVTRRLILQAQQEGTSLGLSHAAVNKVTLEAAKLHAGNQADIVASVTAAAAGAKYQLGSPRDVLRTIYAASQVGAGAVADYGSVFKTVAPSANLAGMSLHSTLGTMALLGGVAPSLSEGGTWFNSFLKAMAKPTGDANEMLQSRTGFTFGDLNARLSEEGGLQAVVDIIKEAFRDDELFSVFGRQEAVKFISSVTAETGALLKLEQAVKENTAAMPIQGFWDHFSKTFSNAGERFSASIQIFLEDFGKPIAAILKGLMALLTPLIDGIVGLNRLTGGLISGIATLVGSIGLSVAAFRGLRFLLGGQLLTAIGDKVGDAVGKVVGDGKPSTGSSAMSKVGVGAGVAGAFAAFAAFWQQIATNIRAFFAGIMGRYRFARNVFEGLQTRRGIAMFTSQYRNYRDKGGTGRASPWMFMGQRNAMDRRIYKATFWMLSRKIPMMLVRLTAIGAILTTIATLFRWFTRNTDAAKEARDRALNRNRMLRHFQSGGTMEDAPIPGETDSYRIQTEQAETIATARRNAFFRQFIDREINAITGFWNGILGWLADKYHAILPDAMVKLDIKLMGWINDWISGFIGFIHTLFTDPLGWLKNWNAKRALARQEGAAGFWGKALEFFGFDDPAADIDHLINNKQDGSTPIPFLEIPTDQAEAAGLTGMPSSFQGSGAIDMRDVLNPVLPVPNIQQMRQFREADAQSMRGDLIVNNTFNISGTSDPEEVANIVTAKGAAAMFQALEDAESPVLR